MAGRGTEQNDNGSEETGEHDSPPSKRLSSSREWLEDPTYPSKLSVVIPIAIYSLAFLVIALYTVVAIWPANPSQAINSTSTASTQLFGRSIPLSDEARILLIAILVGAIGSLARSLASLTSYIGNKKFVDSWTLWYFVRPFMGAALALLIYFAFRGGLITPTTSTKDINLFGIAALSGLAGMFSREATDKLSEVFGTLFKSDVNKYRKDKARPKQDKEDSGSETKKKPEDKPRKPPPMSAGDRHYFAYGSNMNDEDLARWCKEKSKPMVNLRTPKVAVLQDYELVWNYFSNTRKGGVANIAPKPASHVEGVLFELSETDLEVIAQKEGRDTYKRITVSVSLREGGTAEGVITFQVYEDLVRKTTIPPTREYLEIVLKGAENHGLSKSWIEKLKQVRTSEPE